MNNRNNCIVMFGCQYLFILVKISLTNITSVLLFGLSYAQHHITCRLKRKVTWFTNKNLVKKNKKLILFVWRIGFILEPNELHNWLEKLENLPIHRSFVDCFLRYFLSGSYSGFCLPSSSLGCGGQSFLIIMY